MKFALVNGVRQEAQPNLKGVCVGCGSPMTAKCGEVRLRHWAHKGQQRCDSWWEPETEWHRNWKNQFPTTWQEVIHHADNGEKHIADVKTESGWTLEFQHSPIAPEERKSRENFYGNIFWVVDGVRSPQSKNRFLKALEQDTFTHKRHEELKALPSKLEFLKTWSSSSSHVILDFGESQLWWLRPESDKNWSYIVSIARADLIAFHLETSLLGLDAFIKRYDKLLEKCGAFPSLDDYYHFKA